VVLDGTYAFVSGVVASDVAGGAAAHGDVARETEIVMSAIRDALGHANLGMDRIVRVDVHMTDVGRMAELDEVYAVLSRRRLAGAHLHPVGRTGGRVQRRDHGDGADVNHQ
jgi:enamine deaminase RidA (YjgF/YER057c/UK114 family)